jgi:hypothetical protein
MPMKLENPTDESVKDIEKRKYYIQTYKITLMGFLLDEAEYQVSPGITRQLTMFEVDTLNKSRRANIEPPRPDNFDLDLVFVSGNTQLNEVFRYDADIVIDSVSNVTNCYNINYTSTTNNTLTYVNCSGVTVSGVTMAGSQGSVCVKSSTSPSFTVSSGGTINATSSCSSSYSVFINNNYLGDNLSKIQISNGDLLSVIVYKDDPNQESLIKATAFLV